MGSAAKQMLKRRARDAQKKRLAGVRDLGRSSVFVLTKPDGTPLLRDTQKNGEDIVVTWCFTEHARADTFVQGLAEEYNEPLVIAEMKASEFLGSLFHHLSQSDIDLLLLDGETELPLTTIGVRLIMADQPDRSAAVPAGEEISEEEKNPGTDWRGCLKASREATGLNILLAQVAITVLEKVNGQPMTGTYADLVRMLMGKKGSFPAVDLGMVWMLTSAVEGGEEPIFLKLDADSPDNVSGADLAIGPMFFTAYSYALNWPKVLPPAVAAHLAELKLGLIAYRAMGVLEEVNDNFPSPESTVDSRKPDVFLLDGGCLPMSLAGAKYTDELAYGDDKPERSFTTIAEDSELELRKATVMLLARSLGIELLPMTGEGEGETNGAV